MHDPGEDPGCVRRPTGEDVGLQAQFHRVEPHLLETKHLEFHELVVGEVAERSSSPQVEGLHHQRAGPVGARFDRLVCLDRQALEDHRVDHIGGDPQHVGIVLEVDRTDVVPQPRDVPLQGGSSRPRSVVAPYRHDQLVDRDRVVDAEDERREHGTRVSSGDRDEGTADCHLDGPQHSDEYRHDQPPLDSQAAAGADR